MVELVIGALVGIIILLIGIIYGLVEGGNRNHSDTLEYKPDRNLTPYLYHCSWNEPVECNCKKKGKKK